MDWKKVLIDRGKQTYKNDYGHVFVVGGSRGLTGAVCMSAESASKVGAGLVTVGVPKELDFIFEIKLTEEMSLPLSSKSGVLQAKSFKEVERFISDRKVSVTALGPGLSVSKDTQSLVNSVIKNIEIPIVIDADALNVIAQDKSDLDQSKSCLILTPHLGEFSRLINMPIKEIKNKRKKLAKEFAFRYNLILVLKGHRTLITDGREVFENDSGNPGMASGGCGDVLTGIIAGLISQSLKDNKEPQLRGVLLESVRFAVSLHGVAADIAVKEKTQAGLTASDIIDFLPEAIRECLGSG